MKIEEAMAKVRTGAFVLTRFHLPFEGRELDLEDMNDNNWGVTTKELDFVTVIRAVQGIDGAQVSRTSDPGNVWEVSGDVLIRKNARGNVIPHALMIPDFLADDWVVVGKAP